MADFLPAGMNVHPAAAIFPMMTDDELADLAEDIKANGQLHPIILDHDGQLIDGRNRLKACELAGVEPRFESLNGVDPVALILSANVSRRHLSTGQRGMAVALALQLSSRKLRTGGRAASAAANVQETRTSKAIFVVEHAPELAAAVMAGSPSLDAAYEEARRRKSAVTSAEAQMVRLRQAAPDLADLVVEERLTLAGALAELDERKRLERQQRESSTRLLLGILDSLDSRGMSPEEWAEHLVSQFDPATQPGRVDFSPERRARALLALSAIDRRLKELES